MVTRILFGGLGIVAAWATLIALLPKPACQIVASVALIAILLICAVSIPLLCSYGAYAVMRFHDNPAGVIQFSLRSLFAAISVAALALCFVTNLKAACDYVLGVALDAETIYSPNYSAIRWLRVRPGMSKSEVAELLGQPMRKSSYGSLEVWHYTSYGPSESYHRREVYYSREGVTRKLAELYVD